MQGIDPFLWFVDQAEEAAEFYTSVFPDSRVESVTRYGEAGPGPVGSVMTVTFLIGGRRFVALNGGPVFAFTPAVSFVVNCESQEEVDRYWDELTAGGQPGQCGWLTDRYGLSWQIVPLVLKSLLTGADSEASARATEAMLQMGKLIIEDLQRAYDGV